MISHEFDSSGWGPPSPEDFQRMVPQYEVTGLIGRGGMGAVYKARQPMLDREVAIKLLPETFVGGEDELNFAARFGQEARAMASLDHPAIVSVYDFGETSEHQLYFVMEYIDGMDIHEYLLQHGGALPQDQALAIACHVLDALDYAHGRGIVHRDIKPANVLLNREGSVKIADFGLAKTLASAVGDDPVAPALTMTNMAMGTPDYAAPEMLDAGAACDHRVDLYAVGVMLYQLLTGKLPRGNFRSPSGLRPAIDSRLDGIVDKAMAADPAERYGQASEFRDAIHQVLSEPMERVEREARKRIGQGVASRDGFGSKWLWWGLGIGGAAAVYFFVIPDGMRGPEEVGQDSVALAAMIEPPVPGRTGEPESSPVPKEEITPADDGQNFSSVPDPAHEEEATQKDVSETPPDAGHPDAPKAGGELTEPEPEPEPKSESGPEPNSESDSRPVPIPDAAPEPGMKNDGEESGAPAVVSAKSDPPAAHDPLAETAAIPGLESRLRGYLKARRDAVATLATNYRRALEGNLSQAADAGDLAAVNAWREEKSRVEELGSFLAPAPESASAVVAAARERPDLNELPDGAPEALATLRGTWTAERGKILADLDDKLATSLKGLEAELTRARDFENAGKVLAYRTSLRTTEGDAALTVSGNEPVSPPTSTPGTLGSNIEISRATREEPFENSLGMKFVPVPRADVLFCVHETRWKDFAAYAAENEGVPSGWKNQTFDGYAIQESPEEHPVVNILWEEANGFCEWLSKKEGRTYRLPSDREWSMAVDVEREERWRNDTTPKTVSKPQDIFPWGSDWPPPEGAGNFSDQSRKAENRGGNAQYLADYDDGYPTTAPVMRFRPNEFGIYDLAGNAREWCGDWFSEEQKNHVLRGGAWTDHDRGELLSSDRRTTHPYNAGHLRSRGFRVVLERTGE